MRPDSVASGLLGVSGRAMLRALLAGERDANVLAELAKGRLRKKIPELRLARQGLVVFARPRLGATAVIAQLLAWALQWLAGYTVLLALGLQNETGLAAAAAILLAVNVSAILQATPSNVGVFQAACLVVLAAYGVGAGPGASGVLVAAGFAKRGHDSAGVARQYSGALGGVFPCQISGWPPGPPGRTADRR